MTLPPELSDCKVTPGVCFLVEGQPDRRGEVTSKLREEGWQVHIRWASDASFGILAVKLESKSGVV